MGLTLEICVEGVASALAALEGGADRIELCESLAVGGVTPSAGAIAAACRHAGHRPVHVLIRSRGGAFDADPREWEAIRHDLAMAKALGAAGVVFGFLTTDHQIDEDRTAALIAEARPLSVTFHRAFDATADAPQALEILIRLGIDRVLTAGGVDGARVSIERIARLVEQAAGRITILAAGGLTTADFAALARVGVREVHAGSAAARDGGPGRGPITDPDRVRALVAAARHAGTLAGPAIQ